MKMYAWLLKIHMVAIQSTQVHLGVFLPIVVKLLSLQRLFFYLSFSVQYIHNIIIRIYQLFSPFQVTSKSHLEVSE